MNARAIDVPAELLRKLAKPGPRYTSYPTANVFDDSVGPADWAETLARFAPKGRPISLYAHLPFCRSLCHFCACNVIITQKAGMAGAYLDLLEQELELVGRALGGTRLPVTQLHLGGGTPTFFTCEELRRLHAGLAARFDLDALEEAAVEVDPRVTSREQLATLRELGWNRVSFGVQDFEPEVQQAINRVQTREQTEALVEAARELGYGGINLDLIFGLPFQQPESFRRTLDAVLEIRPARIALYSYAHVPWMRVAQKRFEKRDYPLPNPEEKLALFRMAVTLLTGAGYRHLGMDHFALPEDELALARQRRTLHRNFQGYTVRRADDMLALGISAISDLDGVYAQNAKDLDAYREELAAGRLPTIKGWRMTDDDLRRRRAIMALMTGSPLPEGFARDYAAELAELDDLEADGLIRRLPEGLEVTPLGNFFLRNVTMPFDRYLRERADPTQRRFSQTV